MDRNLTSLKQMRMYIPDVYTRGSRKHRLHEKNGKIEIWGRSHSPKKIDVEIFNLV